MPEGPACLNVGCGRHFSKDWTNTDLTPARGVLKVDLRKPLPWQEGSFDATYSSHVLEHLTPEDGLRVLREQFRVLKPGGVCRVAVPDLEGICREYLKSLETATADPCPEALRNHRWMQLELLDQMVRGVSGGEMRKTLQQGEFNEGFVERRMGDQFAAYYPNSPSYRPARAGKEASGIRRVRKAVRSWITGDGDPRATGEVHRWMYDRLSLRLAMEKAGFSGFSVLPFDKSSIPFWDKYNLDRSPSGNRPRKPDSLYAEALKPV